MDSNTIILIHSVANAVISILAIGFHYMAFQSWKRQRKAEAEDPSKFFRAILERIKKDEPAPEPKFKPSAEEYSLYLKEMNTTEDLIPFSDWLIMRRKEANGS